MTTRSDASSGGAYRMRESGQHTLVSVLGLGVLLVLGWRGADVSYAVAAVVGALVGGHAAASFSPAGWPSRANYGTELASVTASAWVAPSTPPPPATTEYTK